MKFYLLYNFMKNKPRTTIRGIIIPIVVVAFTLCHGAGFSQDSTKAYSIPRWKIDRLIKIALKAKECDTLVELQSKTINDGLRTEAKADSVIKSQSELIKTFRQDQVQRDSLQRDLHALVGTESQKKKKWRRIAIGIILLVVVKAVATGSP